MTQRIRVRVPGGNMRSIVVPSSTSGGQDPPDGNSPSPGGGSSAGQTLSAAQVQQITWIMQQAQQTNALQLPTNISAAGSNGQIQYNSGGVLGASANLTFDGNGIVLGGTAGMYYVSEFLGSTYYGSIACTGTSNGYYGWTIDDGWQYPSFMSQGSTALGIYMKTLGEWLILYESSGIEIGSTGTPITTGIWNATTIAPAHGGTGATGTPTSGDLLIGNSGGTYTVATLTAGTGIAVANASGAITVSASGAQHAKAWVNFTGAPAINASFGVSSVALITTGEYTVTFSSTLGSVPAVSFTAQGNTSSSHAYCPSILIGTSSNLTTTTAKVQFPDNGNSYSAPTVGTLIAFSN